MELDLLFYALPSSVEPLAVEWLEQIIEGVDLKRPHRVVVVSGNKDDVRSRLLLKRFEYFEPTELRHLNVQENDVGLVRLDRLYCLTTIRTLRNYIDVRIIFQHLANHFASEWFIVDDQRTNTSCVRHFAS